MKIPTNTLEHAEVGDCTLVLYKWSSLSETSFPRIWENVELFDKNGNKIWTVHGMSESPYWDNNTDMFVGIGNDGKNFILNSYSGNSFFLDLKTGKVIYSGFHK